MKKAISKVLAVVVCFTMVMAMAVGCGSTKKVTITFMNGEETLGTVEVEEGKTLAADTYESYEKVDDAEFAGWFGTPTYLEASALDLTTATFKEDTIVYGCFKSTNVTEDTRVWYIAGTSEAGPLAESNWAADVDDATKAKFELKATGKATNEFALSIDLFAGDQFQFIHDWQWDDQMGFGFVTECDSAEIENGGGLSGSAETSNINVAKDGNYTLTVTTNPDDQALTKISIVRNGDASAKAEVKKDEPYVVTEKTGVKVKGSWVADWSELKDLAKVSDGVFEIKMDLEAGTELYFSVFDGDKDTEIGLKGANVTDDASKALLESGDNVKVAKAGSYTFTVDLNANTIKVTQ